LKNRLPLKWVEVCCVSSTGVPVSAPRASSSRKPTSAKDRKNMHSPCNGQCFRPVLEAIPPPVFVARSPLFIRPRIIANTEIEINQLSTCDCNSVPAARQILHSRGGTPCGGRHKQGYAWRAAATFLPATCHHMARASGTTAANPATSAITP
jgi:hypothetical protein